MIDIKSLGNFFSFSKTLTFLEILTGREWGLTFKLRVNKNLFIKFRRKI